MNKVYTSKIDLLIIVAVIMLGSSADVLLTAIEDGDLKSWLVALLVVAVCVFVFLLIYPTKYIIDGDSLVVHCGFQRRSIPISQITSMRRSHNLLASPALSLDRLEVVFKEKLSDSILISPRNRKAFVEDLKVINPNIDISKAL